MYIVMVYDISTLTPQGQKRWRKIYKLSKQYLNPIQKSVFEGEISESECAIIKTRVNEILDYEEDSVIIFQASNDKWLKKESFGRTDNELSNIL